MWARLDATDFAGFYLELFCRKVQLKTYRIFASCHLKSNVICIWRQYMQGGRNANFSNLNNFYTKSQL